MRPSHFGISEPECALAGQRSLTSFSSVFAATAANLKSVSNSPTPVVSAQATPRVSSPPPTPKTSLGVEVRKGKEAARRGLYSRFLRGVVLGPQEEDEIAALTEVTELVVAGPSSTTEVSPEGDGHEIMKSDKRSKRKAEKTRKTQTPDGTGQKMEKKIARKLAKAKRKAEKELRRASKRPREDAETEVRRAETVPDEVSRRKKKRKKASEA